MADLSLRDSLGQNAASLYFSDLPHPCSNWNMTKLTFVEDLYFEIPRYSPFEYNYATVTVLRLGDIGNESKYFAVTYPRNAGVMKDVRDDGYTTHYTENAAKIVEPWKNRNYHRETRRHLYKKYVIRDAWWNVRMYEYISATERFIKRVGFCDGDKPSRTLEWLRAIDRLSDNVQVEIALQTAESTIHSSLRELKNAKRPKIKTLLANRYVNANFSEAQKEALDRLEQRPREGVV
ncbi:hypothetical protein CAPTEDRAFT_196285 [Capitella teleta]|uniref:Uncharacterized protein n=1 Tax=Capitella teleta TaxID=283909 RepID=R7T4R5_CAPTE|nr:hypothetical protein CAPTEDRAFT_196285 [Capitella teleta]|eukprot:ELT87861.1 hypothetical protein CAPTEDRAFT_196285 [Capitella teleta]